MSRLTTSPAKRVATLIGPLADTDIRRAAPSLPFGEAVRGNHGCLYDPAARSNLLLAGPAKSGRSNAGDVLAAAARVQGSKVIGIRAHGVPDNRFSNFANGLEDAEQYVVELYTELRRRMAELKKRDLRSVDYLPPSLQPDHIYLFVDGLAKLPLQTSIRPEDLHEARAEFYGYLKRAIDLLSRVGVLVRIHVIVVTDRPVPKAPWNTSVLKLRTAGRGTFDDGLAAPISVDVWAAPTEQQVTDAIADEAA